MTINFIVKNIKVLLSIIIFSKSIVFCNKSLSKECLGVDDDCHKRIMESNFDEQVSRELFKCIEHARIEFKIPSLQILITLNKNSKFNCSTGFSNVEKQCKATIENIYYLGSLSKMYVQAIILKLA